MARKPEGIPRPLQPRTKIKVVWYVLFSALGVFHAEVLSWSAPDVLTNPATFAFVTPVYAVHYILFGNLLLRARRDDFPTVYLLGCLTGMYETFITKVFWVPPWNPAAAGPWGIAWIELLWIGFTWHAFMTFLIPFRLMQGLFSPGQGAGRRRSGVAFLLVPPLLGATYGFGFTQALDTMLLAVLLSLLVVLVLALVFLWGSRRWHFTSLDQLVLGRRGLQLAIGAFLAVYTGYGLLLRPEFLPLGLPLLAILGIYAGLLLLLHRVLRKPAVAVYPREGPTPQMAPALRVLALYVLAFAGTFLALAAFHAMFPTVLPVVAGISVYMGAALPLFLLARIVLRTLRAPRTTLPAVG